jgi:hypothetical protein
LCDRAALPARDSVVPSGAANRLYFCATTRYIYGVNTHNLPPFKRPVGPYSRAVQRGVISDRIDGRSLEGRFLRRCEAELAQQIGGALSFAQKLLIRRISRMMLRLEQFDERLDAGTLTEFDSKVFSALNNHIRLSLRELGLKEPPPKPPNLAEYMAKSRSSASEGDR